MRVALVVGTRLQIIKSAPIIKEAGRRGLELDVIHTGQYYDELSRVFFNEPELPDSVAGLGVGSGSMFLVGLSSVPGAEGRRYQ